MEFLHSRPSGRVGQWRGCPAGARAHGQGVQRTARFGHQRRFSPLAHDRRVPGRLRRLACVQNKRGRIGGPVSHGRRDRIRTCDLLLPKQARYQAALLPDDEVSIAQVVPQRNWNSNDGGPLLARPFLLVPLARRWRRRLEWLQ